MIAVTQPIYARKERIKPCPKIVYDPKKEEVNQYEAIIGREARNWFDHSQMIAVLHINPINGEDFFDARVAFHKNGMQLKKYGQGILQRAIKDTKYEALLGLGVNHTFSTAFVFGTEHKKVSTILKILKKFPQMHLLCGVVEDRLMSKNEFIQYANMPSIDIVRSQFTNVLNLAAGQLVQNLSAHQASLVNILEAHVRENAKAKEAEVTHEKPAEEPEKP